MAPPPIPTAPLNKAFPNWEKVIGEDIPLLCTLLFGFAGAYFCSIAVAEHLPDYLETNLYLVKIPTIHTKGLILWLTGLASAAFFASVMSAVYSGMLDPEPYVPALNSMSNRSKEQEDADTAALARFRQKRDFLQHISITAFNFGSFLLPISALAQLPKIGFFIALCLYLLLATWILFAIRALSKLPG